MHIESLATYNFRNLENQNIELHTGVNFVVGKNGQGKTNFIESISLLSRGKSFRTNKARELIRSDQKEASIFANIINNDHKSNIGTVLKLKEKEYYFNQNKLNSLKDFLGRLICISFSPDDLNLIKGGPLERRNFLDKHILDIKTNYIESIFSYQRALKNKSNLLKNSHNVTRNDLFPWNQILSDSGVKIMKERTSLINSLIPRVLHYYRIFASDDSEVNIYIRNSNFDYHNFDSEKMMQIYSENAEKEIHNKTCLVGVHKDDIELSLKGKNSRFYASQGETRSIVLALKISVLDQIEEQRKLLPVLLLDDVDSELDMSRRQALADIIFSKERQIIITGTQLPHFERQKADKFNIFDVSQGVISKNFN